MDVSFPSGVASINPDILVQQMADCQTGLNAEYSNELNRIVDGLQASLQNYRNLDRNHPGLAVPQNGPHSQVVKSSFEELALVILEIGDASTMFEKCLTIANSVVSRIEIITEDSAQSIMNAIAETKQMISRYEPCIPKLTLDSKKMLDLAKKRTEEDISFLGILRRGIAEMMDRRVNLSLQLLQAMGRGFANLKKQQENLTGFVHTQVSLMKEYSRFRDNLTKLQAITGTKVCPDFFTALHQFYSLPQYIRVLLGESFSLRFACVHEEVTKDDLFQLDTLPYEALNHLLQTVPSSTEEGRKLRRKMMDTKAIHYVLDYFAGKVQVHSLICDRNDIGFEDRPHSSSSASTGKMEKALSEEKTTWILNVMLNFVGLPQAGDEDSEFLSEVQVLLKNSSIMSVLAGYLAKDSAFQAPLVVVVVTYP